MCFVPILRSREANSWLMVCFSYSVILYYTSRCFKYTIKIRQNFFVLVASVLTRSLTPLQPKTIET